MTGEALALTASYCCNGAVSVIEPKRGPVVVAKIELCQIAMQMLLCAVLIDAAHAAFENREITFNRVRRYVAARIFIGRMLDRFMFGKRAIAESW